MYLSPAWCTLCNEADVVSVICYYIVALHHTFGIKPFVAFEFLVHFLPDAPFLIGRVG